MDRETPLKRSAYALAHCWPMVPIRSSGLFPFLHSALRIQLAVERQPARGLVILQARLKIRTIQPQKLAPKEICAGEVTVHAACSISGQPKSGSS